MAQQNLPMLSKNDGFRIQHQSFNCYFDFTAFTVKIKSILHIQALKETNVFIFDAYSVNIFNIYVKRSFKICSVISWAYDEFTHSVTVYFDKFCNSMGDLVIEILYSALKEGPSLLWRKDSMSKMVCFSCGSPYNNRSIFISHDRPDAEHTWEAEITVPSEYTVLMSGEANSISESLYTKTFMFKSTIATPISTLAIALGIFGTVSVNNWCKIYGPAMLLSKIHLSTLSYINQSLEEIQKLLGPIPFSQWDIVIVPRCFSNLGFSSPYLAIVSPSTVIGKGLVSKISHEAIHLWYGCSVGLCNWNEDWFTEGIATYFEEYIHKIVLKKLGVQDYQEIAQIRKYMILKRYFDECSNEGTELDRKYIHFLTKESGDYVADGLAYSRSFSQYHYVTGYLIFDKLVCQIGSENFVKFVRTFAENNASRSVLAGDFFQGIKNLYDVPEDLYEIESSRQLMQIHKKVLNELNIKKVIDRILRCLSDKKKRKMADLSKLSNQYESEPLCYLLDMILDWNVNKIRCHSQLDSLVESCKSENGEVRHRICEVILKYDLKRHCDFITEFLGDFQSLGVYVYNEMWLSAKHWQKHLCKKVYNQLIDEYDHSTKLMLQDIMK